MYLYLLATVFWTGLNFCTGRSPVSTFTTCGATGPFGPTQTQCNEAYAGLEHRDVFSLLVVNGRQIITIPFPGIYRFEAFGAGGIGRETSLGAYVTGEFPLPQGAVIKLLVAQQGEGDNATASYGGSGGSFIVRSGEKEPMLVAGGAASSSSNIAGGHYASAVTSGNDASAIGVKYGSAGRNGTGGQSGIDNKGGGGSGFETGAEAYAEDPTVVQAESFSSYGSIFAGTGGRNHNNSATIFSGGFGGGGYAFESSSGGGGGYSGGAGASNGAIPGGGGSFISGLRAKADVSNAVPGKITMQFIDSGVETTCSEHSFTVSLFKELVYGETNFTLEDTSCASTVNDTHIIISSRLDECGTRVSFENGSMVHFKNTIKKSSQSTSAIRYIISDIEISCAYSLRDAVTLNILPEVGEVNFQPEIEEGDFLISTRAFRTIEYKTPYTEDDFPLRVTTNQNIFLEVGISIQINLPGVVLQLDDCFASPSRNLTVDPKHAMINKDCDVDGTLEFLPSPDDTTKRFLFRPVAFPSDHISSAFIHCIASLCQSTETQECRKGCSRQKRHVVVNAGEELFAAEQSLYHRQTRDFTRQSPTGSVGPFIVSENSGKIPRGSTILLLPMFALMHLVFAN